MQLHEVTFAELSQLRHTIRLSEAEVFETPEFLVISYVGEYRYGSSGEPDALYICATAEAAHQAWDSKAIILDFSSLVYRWGDEMEWVTDIGSRGIHSDCPLAIVVGDGCREALSTLFEDDYTSHCVESLSEAYFLARRMIMEYDARVETYRDERLKGSSLTEG